MRRDDAERVCKAVSDLIRAIRSHTDEQQGAEINIHERDECENH